jgi:hypothetical protein
MEETKKERAPLKFEIVAEFTDKATGMVVLVSKSDARVPGYSIQAGARPKGETIDKRVMPFVRVPVVEVEGKLSVSIGLIGASLFAQAAEYIEKAAAADKAARPPERTFQPGQRRAGSGPVKGLKALAKADREKFLERQKRATLHNEVK